MPQCSNLVREIEGYVWDEKKARLGQDAPLKKNDHAVDALRYAVHSHKVSDWRKEPRESPPGYYRFQ